MRMRKWTALAAALLQLILPAAGRADGVTLRTVSCFAGTDSAAEAYVEILNRYESESGNTVTDNSSTSDEAWKTAVLKDFAAGNEPDILFFFAAGADSARFPICCASCARSCSRARTFPCIRTRAVPVPASPRRRAVIVPATTIRFMFMSE